MHLSLCNPTAKRRHKNGAASNSDLFVGMEDQPVSGAGRGRRAGAQPLSCGTLSGERAIRMI